MLDDAEDLDAVAAQVSNGAFWNMGQNCSPAGRLIVQHGVKDRLIAKIRAHAREWVVGDPLNPEVRVGPLLSPAHFAKVSGYLAQAGAVLMGGRVVVEGFIEPTVVEADRASVLATAEIFGPILTVIAVGRFNEAIAVANDTAYGLAAPIFTAIGKRALRVVRLLLVHTGPAGWNAILPRLPPRAALLGKQVCDIAIVGAGFADLSAARRVLQIDPALRVTMLEAGHVAEGAAGAIRGS